MAKIHKKYSSRAKFVFYHGDVLDLLSQVPDNEIQLVVTSPPYNIGKEYERKGSLAAYLEEQEATIEECSRILSNNGSIFWQVGSYVHKGIHIPLDVRLFPIFEKYGMIPRNRIVWIRTHGLHANKRLSCRHETILWFTKSDDYIFNLDAIRVPQKYPSKKSWRGPKKGKLTCDPLGKNPGDVWAFRNVKHNHEEQTIHPCQFPEDMIERIVLAATKSGHVVLDPYMGVGTVAVVARDLKRRFVGAEIRKEYYEVAVHRFRGTPDQSGNFPNLKTLRAYCESESIEHLSQYTFTKQVAKVPTGKSQSRIFPEHVHLERFFETAFMESENSAYRRGLVDLDGNVIGRDKREDSHSLDQFFLFDIKKIHG